tara:strand:+ start:85 stop:930 length:846 start_codon:yes stop_codon:yes gene_type:complete
MPLIINADDLGYSENRDIGIFEAFECNAITAASLMVNGPTCKKAAEKAKELGLYLSLHLNLTEGGSLTGPSSITNEKNEMYYKCDFWNLIHHSIEQYADAIKKETIAQIEKFKELTGGYPAHIDGHQHVHIFPNMPDILAPIFSKYGVKSTRVPDEDISNYEWLDAERKERYESRFPTCLRGRLVYRSYNILAPECFIGLALMGEYMSRERFFNSLTGAFGTIEWMVHPGKIVQKPKLPRSFFRDLFDQSPEREHELITLKNIEHTCPLTDWSHYDFNKDR